MGPRSVYLSNPQPVTSPLHWPLPPGVSGWWINYWGGRQEKDGGRWTTQGGPLGREAGGPGKRPLPGDPQSWPSNSPTPRPALQCLICKKRADNSHLANLQAGLWEPRQSQLCHNIKLVTNAHLDGALSLMADAVLSPRPVSRQPLPRKLPSADESPGLGTYTIPRRTPDSAAWTGERLPLPQGGAALGFIP